MPIRRLAALAAGIALAFPPPAARAELLAEKRDWTWIESAHFRLLTDGATRAGAEVVEELERFRSLIAQLLPRLTLNESRPTYVVLFRDERGFRSYPPLGADGKPLRLGGLFAWSEEANYILMPSVRHEEFFSTVYHEYFHYLVANNEQDLPVWANEGIAEFYSTFRYRARDGAVDIGRIVDQHVRFLASFSGVPVARLLVVRPDSPEYNESARHGSFYAQAWLLTHWMLLGETAPAGAFARFLNASAGGDPVASLEQATGMSLARIEEELTRYRQRRTFNYRIYPVADLPAAAAIVERPARPEEALALLAGYLGRHPERRAEAEEHVAAVERLAPGSPLAVEARARLAGGGLVGIPIAAPPAPLETIDPAPLEADRPAPAARKEPDELAERLREAHRRYERGEREAAMADAAWVRDRSAAESTRSEATRLHARILAELATELTGQERWAEAEALLARELDAAPSPVDGQLAGLLTWVRGAREQDRQIAAYDAAMALAEQGRYEEAAAALRKLLAEGAGPTEEMARQMLGQLDAYLARRTKSGASGSPGS